MKKVISIVANVILLIVFASNVNGQATTANNTPTGGEFLGWDDPFNTNLNILQNNTLRERFTSVN